MLIKVASDTYSWDINQGAVALMWRGGCIIRSKFLGDINQAYSTNPNLETLLSDEFFESQIKQQDQGWRKIIKTAVDYQIALPAMSSALAFYDGIRTKSSSANLIQAQRDFFGAHTYELVDGPRGEFKHTDWTGHGGSVSSSSYQV